MSKRCAWADKTPLEISYHDKEWGVPVHDDGRLFEFLILEGAQAGLSWITILKKREGYRLAFDQFEPMKIAAYDEQKLQQLIENPQIVRNRLKINATVSNARAFLEVQEKWASFDNYIWQFTDGQTLQNQWGSPGEVPASDSRSESMSKDLKRLGFKFVGPTICYAFMQATGMVNDHTTDCFRHAELQT